MEDINKEGWKCLGEIMFKWIEYKSLFYRVGKNILEATIFGNEIVLEGGGSGKISKNKNKNKNNLFVHT